MNQKERSMSLTKMLFLGGCIFILLAIKTVFAFDLNDNNLIQCFKKNDVTTCKIEVKGGERSAPRFILCTGMGNRMTCVDESGGEVPQPKDINDIWYRPKKGEFKFNIYTTYDIPRPTVPTTSWVGTTPVSECEHVKQNLMRQVLALEKRLKYYEKKYGSVGSSKHGEKK